MPLCVCGLKVERNHGKLMCKYCFQFFHLECCNVKPEDVDLIKDSFKCSMCARRNSPKIAPTPAIIIQDQGSDLVDEGPAKDNTVLNPANSDTATVVNVIDLSLNSSSALLDLSMSAVPEVPSNYVDKVDINSINSTLQLLLKEISEVKRTNVELVTKVSTLESSNTLLLKKVEAMERSLSRLGQDSSPKRKKSNVSAPTVLNKPAVQAAISSGSNSSSVKNATLPTFSSVTCPIESPSWPPLESSASNWSTIVKKSKRTSAMPAVPIKSKKPVVVGQGSNDDLSVVDKKKWLHLSSFKNNVTSDDIVNYVEKHFNVSKSHLVCYSLVKKDAIVTDLKHINFKLGVSAGFVDKLFDASLWPVNIKVRYFDFLEKVVDLK